MTRNMGASDDVIPGTMPSGRHAVDPAPVAGVTPVHISDGPLYRYQSEQPGGYAGMLASNYHRAQDEFERVGLELVRRGLWDDRVCELLIYDDQRDESPSYSFLVNQMLLDRIEAARRKKGTELSQDELLAIGLSEGEDAVDPNFSPDAINAVNASYYASDIAFSESARLAKMFVANRPLNRALGVLMAQSASAPDNFRVKELSSGTRVGHWSFVAEGLRDAGVRQAEATLTDFVEPPVESGSIDARLSVRAERYSLFDDLPELAAADRYDAFITTYGFDSVWQPEDISLRHIEGQWYQHMYRVKVADWAPRREELLAALRHGEPLSHSVAGDYDGIFVESATQPVDISSHPYASYITSSDQRSVNVPGGLIKRVVNAFSCQLKDGGVFISGDVGKFGFKDSPYSTDTDKAVSGVAARYRVDDYLIAQQVLEREYGLEVTLMSLSELVEAQLPPSWQADSSAHEQIQIASSPSNGVMVVRRRPQSKQ